jgi:hypothetical protein
MARGGIRWAESISMTHLRWEGILFDHVFYGPRFHDERANEVCGRFTGRNDAENSITYSRDDSPSGARVDVLLGRGGDT